MVPTPERYAPEALVALPRALARARDGVGETEWRGVDLWEATEVSWLDVRGKPRVALGELRVPADSACLVESKSLKLYLHSLNGERMAEEEVRATIARDLSRAADADVEVRLLPLDDVPERRRGKLPGCCIDEEPLEIERFELAPELLDGAGRGVLVDETLTTHLFRSLCPVTGQPDWASLALSYRGPRIDRASLLGYWLSFRETAAFHESCVERMFVDLTERCSLEWIDLEARFAPRGGLAIHPRRWSLHAPSGAC